MTPQQQARQTAYEAFRQDSSTTPEGSPISQDQHNAEPVKQRRKTRQPKQFDNDFYMSGFENARRIRATARTNQLTALKGR